MGIAIDWPGDIEADLLICRVASEYGYSVEYIRSLSIEWIGKLLSFKDGLNDLQQP